MDFMAGLADESTNRRIVEELTIPDSYASRFIDESCLEARTLYELIDWNKLAARDVLES